MLAAALTASYSYAQEQFTFGVRAGFNLTNLYGDGESGDFKPGFQVGVVGDYAFTDAFSFQPGLLFATQGSKGDLGDFDDIEVGSGSMSWNLNYIQIPLNFQYKADLGSAKLLLQAGPYLGYGISSKIKVKTGGISVSMDGPKFGSGDENLKPFDLGIGLGAGLQFGNLQVGAGYNLGLTSMDPVGAMKNNGIAVTLTYFFGK